MVGRIGGHISFSDLGTKDQDRRGFRFSLPVFSYLIGFASFVWHSSSVSRGRSKCLGTAFFDRCLGEWRYRSPVDFIGHWNQSSFPRIACVVKGWLCGSHPHRSGLALCFHHKMCCLHVGQVVSRCRNTDHYRCCDGSLSYFLCGD